MEGCSMNAQSPIGVFDSGMGGLTVLDEIHQLMPGEDLIFIGDSKHNPYGTKSKEEVTERSIAICDWLVEKGVKSIVIACNTATSACVPLLRKRYDIDIIGMEPALKPACEKGEHQRIAVWATQLTLQEKKFARLMARYQDEHTITKVPCPKLVEIVEEDRLDQMDQIHTILQDYIRQSGPVDSIVLGCTHFVYYKDSLVKELSDRVSLIDGNEGTARHLKDILMEKNLLNERGGAIQWMNSDPSKIELSKRLYQRLENKL